MLGLIGWGESTSDTFTLIEFVTVNAGGGYDIAINGPWIPEPGDTFTDPSGQVDTVVRVEDPGASLQTFHGVINFGVGTWVTGQTTIVRKRSAVPPATANFRGVASAIDNPSAGRTDLTLGTGNVIRHTLASNTQAYSPPGWAYASTVVVLPSGNPTEIRSAHWWAPQGVKLIINRHATFSLVIKHSDEAVSRNEIFMADAADITLTQFQSAALIRDTQGSNFRWRATRAHS